LRPIFAACLVAIALVSGCVRATGGNAVRAPTPTLSDPAEPVPGIVTTVPEHIPPNAFICFPKPSGIGVGTVAQVSDPAAPRITVTVPDGWTSQPGQNDVALTLNGPDEMTGTVSIADNARPRRRLL
jgi:hypothetical protein